jgi:GNAT superfamily N-acetyltransferase
MEIGPLAEGDLEQLLRLYRHLHPGDPPLEVTDEVRRIWGKMLADPSHHLIGAYMGEALVSTCSLIVIPNLTRSARPYALIENVVTHPDHRNRGIGTAVLRHALGIAWDQGCYKVMLLTGRKDAATLRFYEKAGFLGGVKTGFIAYPPVG